MKESKNSETCAHALESCEHVILRVNISHSDGEPTVNRHHGDGMQDQHPAETRIRDLGKHNARGLHQVVVY